MNLELNNNEPIAINHSRRPKKVFGLSGIVNIGNTTCYMNSAIQVLSWNYLLTNYLFGNKKEIYDILIKNARKIFMDHVAFKTETSSSRIPMLLRLKIQNPHYDSTMLDSLETTIVLNNTITVQLIKLLEIMWAKNNIVIPSSFRKVFCEARDNFFHGHEQHDAEEAYSCIMEMMQKELGEEKNIQFKTSRESVHDFLVFKNDIDCRLKATDNEFERREIIDVYNRKKREMPDESLTVNAFSEMKKYYGASYSKITEMFTGFLYSSTNCPDSACGYISHKFDPFLHLSFPMQTNNTWFIETTNTALTIRDCMIEYFKTEILDEKNLWKCEGCGNNVKAIKKSQLWTTPSVLVIQLKRFGILAEKKDSRLVTFPLKNFDIGSFLSPIQKSTSKCTSYKLHCVINHIGGLHGGHYYSFCLNEDTDKWYIFNDTKVTEIATEKIISKAAYLLFYIRDDIHNRA